MKKTAEFLVDRRRAIFFFMMLLAILSAALIPRVRVNTDMTRYLPDSSSMKQGIDIMAQEFSDLSVPNTVRVMFHDLPEEEKDAVLAELKETPHVNGVSFIPDDPRYEKDGYVLYILDFTVGFFSAQMQEAENYIRSHFSGRCGMVYCLDKTQQQGVPVWIIVLAVSLLLVFLLLFSCSWAEPFLFLFAMGIAVVINMGSNVLLPYISEITWSIGAILQLALSIDYSVILMSRYRQELALTADRGKPASGPELPEDLSAKDRERAMKAALQAAFSSISGSAFTTVVGFLVLVFMSFKIGRDMGLVMAKGVLLSMVSILTVLPFLVLALDGVIQRTRKKSLSLKMDAAARFSYRHRRGITLFFAVFCVLVFVEKGNTGIAFTMLAPNEIDPVFPKENQIILLYENADEEAAADIIPELEKESGVNSVMAWPNTLGKAFTADELAEFVSAMGGGMGYEISPELIRTVYFLYFGGNEQGRLTVSELVSWLSENVSKNVLLKSMMPEDLQETLAQAPAMLEEAGHQLKGPEHSIMAISTSLPAESDETGAFMERLRDLCGKKLSGAWYLIGNTPMAMEMVDTFSGELNFLTLLTAAAIFLVVLVIFRSPAVPAILVLLIQSGVYATMVMINLQGMTIYYIALLVVQSILMGATIDYAILFTNYYREMRMTKMAEEALTEAYNRSIHTILTSGSIVVSVTAIVGYAFEDPSVRQIVHTISKGAACAVLLILFVLPGLLAALDRITAGQGALTQTGVKGGRHSDTD